MPLRCKEPEHQHPWYWVCRMCKFLSYLRKYFNYLCHVNVEKRHRNKDDLLYPRTTKLLGVYIGFTPSVRPSVQFWLDPFLIYTSCQAASEGVLRVKFLAKFQNLNFWQFKKNGNFDFVLTWDLMWITSMGNHGMAGGISERRRSSCSRCQSDLQEKTPVKFESRYDDFHSTKWIKKCHCKMSADMFRHQCVIHRCNISLLCGPWEKWLSFRKCDLEIFSDCCQEHLHLEDIIVDLF